MKKEIILKKVSALADEAEKADEPALSMRLHAVAGFSYLNFDPELLEYILPFTEKVKELATNEMKIRLT
jgi:hypothetical protein